MPANFLNLPSYRVLQVETNDHDYHIDAETIAPPITCPHCQSSTLEGFGRREQMVKDLPMHGKRVGVYVTTRRYRRKVCRITIQNTDVNAEQLRRGMAWVYRQYARDSAYYQYEQNAKTARRGLWSDQSPVSPWEWRRARRAVSNNY
jgi:Micrococcal nuclease (thermonuclease) homologs